MLHRVVSLAGAVLAFVACKGDEAKSVADASADSQADGADVFCQLAGAARPGGITDTPDEFGPNAVVSKTPSSLARMNIYEVTSASVLTNAEIFLQPTLSKTRVTITVAEAPSKMAGFKPLMVTQIDLNDCPGFVSAGALAIPMHPGRFYAIGYDPNQAVNYTTVSEAGTLPVDGVFGRLIGSRTDTSVSMPMISWDKFTDKEYARQRLTTRPGANNVGPSQDAGVAGN